MGKLRMSKRWPLGTEAETTSLTYSPRRDPPPRPHDRRHRRCRLRARAVRDARVDARWVRRRCPGVHEGPRARRRGDPHRSRSDQLDGAKRQRGGRPRPPRRQRGRPSPRARHQHVRNRCWRSAWSSRTRPSHPSSARGSLHLRDALDFFAHIGRRSLARSGNKFVRYLMTISHWPIRTLISCVSRGKGLAYFFMLALALSGCAQAPRASDTDSDITLPDDRPLRATAPVDMLRCTDRTTIPALDNVTSVAWSADSSAVAMSRINVIPSHTTITGYEEQLQLTVYYVRSGRVQEIGQGSRPQWSGSGAYLSYWRDDGLLYIYLDGTIAGTIEASSPEVRWSGDELYFWYDDEIRVWRDGVGETVAHVDSDLIPRYPRDDAYFSADAKRFTVTRYHLDGTTERYIGVTATGVMTRLEAEDATFTEWSPRGETMLVRSNDKLAVMDPSGTEE